MPKRGVSRAIHYIDDFLTIGRRDSQKCMCNIALMQRIYDEAGLPIEPSKSVGPPTTLVFLGIEIDSVREELRLPEDKLMQLKEALSHWRGLLSHAAKVVKAGRTFLRRIIDLSTSASQLHHFIRLNTEARSDIEWWFRFISLWNGISMLPSHDAGSREILVFTDASGLWGFGAVWNQLWLQLEWAGILQDAHIATKELTPIMLAAAIWGSQWKGRSVKVLSDNSAAVAAINKQSSRVPMMGHLLKALAFICGKFQIQLGAFHLPGTHNCAADAISRNNMMHSTLYFHRHADSHSEFPAASSSYCCWRNQTGPR